MSIDEVLAQARSRLRRLEPEQALRAVEEGALLVDTRSAHQRQEQGTIPAAVAIERNVLEWRLDPTSPWRLPGIGDDAQQVIVMCAEGYSSSLAAASLQDLGLLNATDVIGGALAWIAAGLPVEIRSGGDLG
jgi:rhodanese-related sulfurtransferase